MVTKKKNEMEDELRKMFSSRNDEEREALVARRKPTKFASLVVPKR